MRRNLFFFEATLHDAVPEVLEELERCFEVRVDGRELSFGSWAGLGHGRAPGGRGRDARAHARRCTARPRCGSCATRSTGSRRASRTRRRRAPVSPALEASLERDAAELPSARVLRRANREFEPLRTKLGFITRRLTNMLDPLAREPGYADPQELRDDLWLVLDSVGSAHVAHGSLRRLLWQVDVFGFHVASLDVRQSAAVVQEAVAALLPGYARRGRGRARVRAARGGDRRSAGAACTRGPTGAGGRAAARARHGRPRARGVRRAARCR